MRCKVSAMFLLLCHTQSYYCKIYTRPKWEYYSYMWQSRKNNDKMQGKASLFIQHHFHTQGSFKVLYRNNRSIQKYG